MATASGPANIESLTDAKHNAARSADTAPPVVLDMGKHRRKAVKQLRRGSGKLMDEVTSAVDELRAAGAIAPGAQPVIVVVQQKPRKDRGWIPGL